MNNKGKLMKSKERVNMASSCKETPPAGRTPEEVERHLAIIEKGCDELVDRAHLAERLAQGAVLRVKFGMDPTAPDLHLGHAVPLRKLRQMQTLGHLVIIVIGDATAVIGDPSGRSKTRRPMTREEVLGNAETYQAQLFRILDPARTEIRFNSEWLSGMNLEAVLHMMATVTVAQVLEREDFSIRMAEHAPIGLHEFLYPLMQAQDSVALEADLELGGTDQRFNILMGRVLQRHAGQVQQSALFMPLLEGLDGVEKMSKSLGNQIGIHDTAEVMFEKVMRVPDALVLRYFLLCTDELPDTVAQWAKRLQAGMNPRDVKMALATHITALYKGEAAAREAALRFQQVFTRRQEPQEMPALSLQGLRQEGLIDPLALLVASGLTGSRGEARRLIRQGGVHLNGARLTTETPIRLDPGDVLRCGRNAYLRLTE